ncbi:GNAT family N-acetyltransferase [Paenactinomyces guangxiensis]|uniref:GNAT family N-acetyltransferase n=1 Tax=Paenactinomyces guangxiensis TaxID=1490290 RepID=A0A7W2AAA5_9BACL|nr:GNAT family N-acetyltransferase [Paenactinomyces guangxiensis]MBA4496067.1 GNAT family N-acetyltransferase [Paenactinomyces guangxiensis]MBH8593155.1 GNAT family N-acetyltransferase [Paenactinomyces guangxiensis]
MEWKHEYLPYRISDCKDQLELDTIYTLLQTSYWAAGRTKETIEKSIENSLCVGIYGESGQVGFMRVVTDYATFSWVCDVIVHPDHRGKGLGKWMMQFLVEHPGVRHTHMTLGTRDAHGLYEQYGFERKEMMGRRYAKI